VQYEAHVLSSADPGLPIDWQAPRRWQAARKAPAVYSAAVGVHDDAGDLAAAHRHRHGQRAVGQSGVVVHASAKPSTRREAMSRTEAR
jgi:hypothetical protein